MIASQQSIKQRQTDNGRGPQTGGQRQSCVARARSVSTAPSTLLRNKYLNQGLEPHCPKEMPVPIPVTRGICLNNLLPSKSSAAWLLRTPPCPPPTLLQKLR